MNSKTKLIKSTSIYFVGKILSKIITFLMLPLYTKVIPAYDMGEFDYYTAIVAFFVSVIFIEIQTGMLRFVLEKNGVYKKENAITTSFFIFLISLVIYFTVAVILNFTLNIKYLWLIVGYGIIIALENFWSSIARGYGKNSVFALYGIIVTIFTVIFNLLFLLVLKWDYKSLYLAAIFSGLIGILFLEINLKAFKKIKKRYSNKDLFKELIKYSMPLCVNSIAFWLLSSVNRVLVTNILGSEANGYLAVANKFNQILYLISTCFQLAWQELAYSRDCSNKIEEGKFYSKAFDLYFKIIALSLALLIPLIKLGLIIYPAFIDSSYNTSINLIPLALAGCFMSIMSSFFSSIFGAFKKTGFTLFATTIGAIANIALAISLLTKIGVMAANISFLIGFTLCVIAKIIFLNKFIGLKIKPIPIIFGLIIISICIFVYSNLNWIYNLIVALSIIIIAIIIFRKNIKNLFFKLRNKA